MRKNYTRKLETPIGTFYLEYGDFGDSTVHCALLDSDKIYFANIFHKENIKKLKNIQSIGDIVDICALQNCTWAPTIEELAKELNDIYHWYEECEDERWNAKDLAKYDFLYRVGDTYFVVDYEC